MSLSDLLKDYRYTTNDCLLKETTEDLNSYGIPEFTQMLKDGYSSKDSYEVRMVSVLNSIFTHHAQTFLLTKKSLTELLEQDIYVKKKSINTATYKCFMNMLNNNGHFECLRKPSNNKSGVYKLIQKDLVENLYKLHSAEWFKSQEQKVIDYYDETNKEQPKRTRKRMYEIAVERMTHE
jgi:hypothetical protein